MGDEKCTNCGATLEGTKFVCVFCGRATSAVAKTTDDEFVMVRELARAAQAVAAGGADADVVEAFWQMAPLPRFPEPLAQACREALAGITGTTDGNFNLVGGQRAMRARAEACIAALESHPGQEQVCRLLRGQLDAKRKMLRWYKSGGVMIFLGFLLFIGIAGGISLCAARADPQVAEFLHKVSGNYRNGGARLAVSGSALALGDGKAISLKVDNSNYTKSLPDGTGVSFNAEAPRCTGTIVLQGDGLVITASGKGDDEEKCKGFSGRWEPMAALGK